MCWTLFGVASVVVASTCIAGLYLYDICSMYYVVCPARLGPALFCVHVYMFLNVGLFVWLCVRVVFVCQRLSLVAVVIVCLCLYICLGMHCLSVSVHVSVSVCLSAMILVCMSLGRPVCLSVFL